MYLSIHRCNETFQHTGRRTRRGPWRSRANFDRTSPSTPTLTLTNVAVGGGDLYTIGPGISRPSIELSLDELLNAGDVRRGVGCAGRNGGFSAKSSVPIPSSQRGLGSRGLVSKRPVEMVK